MSAERFQRNLKERWWTLFVWGIVMVFACRFAAGVVLYGQPRIYESVAVLRESPPAGLKPGAELAADRPIATRIAKVLDLEGRWAMSDRNLVVAKVVEAVRMVRPEGGDTTEIRVRSRDPTDARDIADAALEHYGGWHRRQVIGGLSASDQDLVIEFETVAEQRVWKNSELRSWMTRSDWDGMKRVAMEMANEGREGPKDDFLLRREVQTYADLTSAVAILGARYDELRASLMEMGVPEPAPPEVLERPIISPEPVSPDIERGLRVGTRVGLALGALLWLAYLWRWCDPEKVAQQNRRRVENLKKAEEY